MADENDIADEASPTGGGKTKLLIGVVVLVVLLIGGGAAFFLLGGGDGADEEEQVAAVEERDPLYHRLDPVFVVTLPPGGPAKMLQIAIELLTYDPAVIGSLEANDPMIRHHLLNLLERQQGQDLLSLAGKRALREAIFELLSERLAELEVSGEIRGVFFTQFVMQ